jgi:hypothetical protein
VVSRGGAKKALAGEQEGSRLVSKISRDTVVTRFIYGAVRDNVAPLVIVQYFTLTVLLLAGQHYNAHTSVYKRYISQIQ